MAITNHERVGKALDLLKAGLGPFVEREVRSALDSRKVDAHPSRSYGEDRALGNKPIPEHDVAGLLKLMWDTWHDVFREILGPAERSLVSELRGHRNKWAHQESFPAMTPIAPWIRWADSLLRYPRRSPKSSRSASWSCCGCASTNRRAESGASRREWRLKAPPRPA